MGHVDVPFKNFEPVFWGSIPATINDSAMHVRRDGCVFISTTLGGKDQFFCVRFTQLSKRQPEDCHEKDQEWRIRHRDREKSVPIRG